MKYQEVRTQLTSVQYIQNGLMVVILKMSYKITTVYKTNTTHKRSLKHDKVSKRHESDVTLYNQWSILLPCTYWIWGTVDVTKQYSTRGNIQVYSLTPSVFYNRNSFLIFKDPDFVTIFWIVLVFYKISLWIFIKSPLLGVLVIFKGPLLIKLDTV